MTGWTIVVPVKRFAQAKSRLDLPPNVRVDFAAAFARDVIQAVCETGGVDRVVVVSSERSVHNFARRCGATIVLDPLLPEGDALNAAIRRGVAWAGRRHPDGGVAVVPADLPNLTGEALAITLSMATAHERSCVADFGGDGTTILAAARPDLLDPRFGPGSAARHRRHGHTMLTPPHVGLRRDVDTVSDLTDAVDIGVGGFTFSAVWRHADVLCDRMGHGAGVTAGARG